MTALATSSSFHFGSAFRNLVSRLWRWVRIAAYSVARAARWTWGWTVYGVVSAYSWVVGLFSKKAA